MGLIEIIDLFEVVPVLLLKKGLKLLLILILLLVQLPLFITLACLCGPVQIEASAYQVFLEVSVKGLRDATKHKDNHQNDAPSVAEQLSDAGIGECVSFSESGVAEGDVVGAGCS